MKLKILPYLTVASISLCATSSASAFDLKGLINKGAEIVNRGAAAVSEAVNEVIDRPTAPTTMSFMEGAWKYSEPAVSISANGSMVNSAATNALSGELTSIYKANGISRSTLSVYSDGRFTMNISTRKLTGKIKQTADGYELMYEGTKSIPSGSINARITVDGSRLNITFDFNQLSSLAKTIGVGNDNNIWQNADDLLSCYDSVFVGFVMNKI